MSRTLLCVALTLSVTACKDKGEGGDTGASADAPTYWADIAPLYAERCVTCHQDGGLGPMPLEDYADAVQWADASAASVAARTMPPWGAEGPSDHGGGALAEGVTDPGDCDNEYVDTLWLSDAEVEMIADWVAAGAPEGTQATITPPEQAALEGTVETLSTPTFLPVASDGEGGEYDEYRCFVIDPGWSADAWLTGYEVLPGNDAIVHHVIAMPVDPAVARNAAEIAARDGADGREGWPCYSQAGEDIVVEGEYIAWAPGQGVVRFPQGSGLSLGADDLVVVQVHYNMVSTDNQTDATQIRLQVADSVERPAQLALIDDWGRQVLSAGDAAATVQWQLRSSAIGGYLGMDSLVIEGVMPHMHELGVQQTLEVGPVDEMACATGVRSWDFGWQRMYFYQEPVALEEGDMLRVTCTYDLSGVDHDVTWGWGTQDEMCLTALYVTER